MSHLNLRSHQISLELPGERLECDVDQRRARPPGPQQEDGLSAARGILIALGLSACLWAIVFALVALF
ncbi:hypothetical protein [Peristeroidobacter soli]|uniref:hypothetical protein n=1 Tax=Peristeroidobacter soli TaxID=2497877 RepID=UPI00101C48A8|nr:hypothetical protein [Peristeroidobacter soli]